MSKRIRILGLSIFGIVMLGVMVAAIGTIFYFSGRSNSYQVKNTDPTTASQTKNAYQILSMGDSLANGTGDVSGLGFAKDYAQLLQKSSKTGVNVTNLAVNGDTSDGLLNIVKNEKTAEIIKSANLIFLSIGGNEVDKFVGDRSMDSNDTYDTVQKKYSDNLTSILSIIRGLNKDCKIGFLGLYNPYGHHLSQASEANLLDWNTKTQALLLKENHVFYIPTYDLFEYHQTTFLTIDHFHPNIDGYQAIANRIEEILNNADNQTNQEE